MSTSTILAILVELSAAGQVPRMQDPPKPDFQKPVDYVQWLRDQVRFADADNAWQEYRQFMEDGREVQPPDSKPDQQLERLFHSPQPWSDEYAALASWLKSIEPQLAAYAAGSRRKFFARPIDQNAKHLLDVTLPGTASSRVLSKAMIANAWQSAGVFDGQRFAEHVSTLLRYANHLNQATSIIDQLIALGIRSLVYTSIAEALGGDFLNAAEVQQLQTLLEREDAGDCVAAMDRGLVFELAFVYDNLQVWCTNAGAIKPQFSREAADQARRFNQEKGLPITSDAAVERILQEDPVALATRLTGMCQALRKAAVPSPTHQIDDFANGEHEKLASSAFCEQFAPNLARAFAEAIHTETRRRGISVMLAVTRFKTEKGSWPAKLDDPALKLPPAVRSDPRSKGDLVYKVQGNGVTLYSVGRDGQDNGGKQLGAKYEDKPGEDLVIWPSKR